MCTRFYIENDISGFRKLFEEVRKSALADRFIRKLARPVLYSGEIQPTDIVPVIAPDRNGNKAAFPMKWGFTLQGSSQPLVNARVETAASKPTFKESWIRHRCVVPASWYYEWKHYQTSDGKTKTGDKYLIQPKDSSVTWLCGLYRIEGDLPVFTILTKAPTEELAQIHDRMPLILPESLIDDWINPSLQPEKLIPHVLTDMVIERATS